MSLSYLDILALRGSDSSPFVAYHYTIDVLGAFVFTFLCWYSQRRYVFAQERIVRLAP